MQRAGWVHIGDRIWSGHTLVGDAEYFDVSLTSKGLSLSREWWGFEPHIVNFGGSIGERRYGFYRTNVFVTAFAAVTGIQQQQSYAVAEYKVRWVPTAQGKELIEAGLKIDPPGDLTGKASFSFWDNGWRLME